MRLPLLLALCVLLLPALAAADVTITVLDVGQGDATLVQSSAGGTLLFDGGPSSSIVGQLQALGVTSIDYVVVSHYHLDHIGGIDNVYEDIPVTGGVWDRGGSYTTVSYNNYAALVAPDRHTLSQFHVFDLGGGVTVTCLALNGNGELAGPFTDGSHENDYCVSLLVECGDFDFFQAGDLIGIDGSGMTDIETSVAATMASLGKADVEVYQVNHHGSYTSSNANFLNGITPEVAVNSVGANNSYGHPHEEVMLRLQERDIFVYQTTIGGGYTLPAADMTVVGGHVVIATDGTGEYTVDGDLWDMDEQGGTPVDDVPAPFALRGNHPNPFNPATSIGFRSASGGAGRLEIYDLAGRLVAEQAFTAPAGDFAVTWRGRDITGRTAPAGVYTYRVTVPDGAGVGRMTLAK
jgi:beta-lactamase superfamily II metal-dependent hydrolase